MWLLLMGASDVYQGRTECRIALFSGLPSEALEYLLSSDPV